MSGIWRSSRAAGRRTTWTRCIAGADEKAALATASTAGEAAAAGGEAAGAEVTRAGAELLPGGEDALAMVELKRLHMRVQLLPKVSSFLERSARHIEPVVPGREQPGPRRRREARARWSATTGAPPSRR